MGAPFFFFFLFWTIFGIFKGGEGGVWIGLGWVGGSGSKFLGRIPRRYYNGGVGGSKKKQNQTSKQKSKHLMELGWSFFFSRVFFLFSFFFRSLGLFYSPFHTASLFLKETGNPQREIYGSGKHHGLDRIEQTRQTGSWGGFFSFFPFLSIVKIFVEQQKM